jgi:hypothetical protein
MKTGSVATAHTARIDEKLSETVSSSSAIYQIGIIAAAVLLVVSAAFL